MDNISTVNVVAIKQLKEAPGWRELEKEVNLWIEDIKNILADTNEDDEKNRGRIDALRMVLAWPEQIIELVEAEREPREPDVERDSTQEIRVRSKDGPKY